MIFNGRELDIPDLPPQNSGIRTCQVKRYNTTETYELTKLFCLRCGQKPVWAETVGDIYAGETHICLTCGGCWCMSDSYGEPNKFEEILEQLRSQVWPQESNGTTNLR